jgi:DNA-binding Lrp family transcriptional regulator
MEDFRRKMAKLEKSEYPEMLREITAFVLMNVSAKKEVRLVDKLINLKEVKEVHSVHGSVDIIAKIVLKRDLVSSDAETIGDFIHNKIRQLSGVISTQTLIPGYSQTKKTDES